MIQMGVRQHHSIKRIEWKNFRDIDIWIKFRVAGHFTTIDEYLTLRCRKQKCCTANFPTTPKGCYPNPPFFTGDITVNPPSDTTEKFFSFIPYRTQILAHVFHSLALYRRCTDHLRSPSDLLGDIP